MPDIDPSALNRPEPIQTSLNPSSLSLSKPNGISAPLPASKAAKTVTTGLQRIDLEPIYTSLKAAAGEHWVGYKEAIGRFVIGMIPHRTAVSQSMKSCKRILIIMQGN